MLELRIATRIVSPDAPSDLVKLIHIPVKPISRAFRRAIRDNEFDVSEMALVTLAMAHDLGYPWKGLPLVLMSGNHRGALRVSPGSPIRGPHDLPGKRIGVRAYSQTTGVWVRGILASEYGITPDQMKWITTEDAHVPGFNDPPFVERAPEGVKLESLFANGQIDAVIGDSSTQLGETRSVVTESAHAADVLYVNHVLALRNELVDQYPWLPAELISLFRPQPAPVHAVNLGLQFAFEQGLTSKQYKYEDMFCYLQ